MAIASPIAPKMIAKQKKAADEVSSSSMVKGGTKKYHHPTLGYAIPPPQPAKVARRNARERNRVKQVNCGFEMLRSHIPSASKHKKMSKVDTLRHAVEYIQNLQNMLDGGDMIDPQTKLEEEPFVKPEVEQPAKKASKPKATRGRKKAKAVESEEPKPLAFPVTTQPQPFSTNYNQQMPYQTPHSPDFSTTESGYETSSYASYNNGFFHSPISPSTNEMVPNLVPMVAGTTTCHSYTSNQHHMLVPDPMYDNRANSVSPVFYQQL